MAGSEKKVEQYLHNSAICHKEHVTNPCKARTSKAYFRPRKFLLTTWFSAAPCINDSDSDN